MKFWKLLALVVLLHLLCKIVGGKDFGSIGSTLIADIGMAFMARIMSGIVTTADMAPWYKLHKRAVFFWLFSLAATLLMAILQIPRTGGTVIALVDLMISTSLLFATFITFGTRCQEVLLQRFPSLRRRN